jgi:hypothetical protein
MPTIWPKPDILELSVHGDFVLRHNYLKLNISNKLHILVFLSIPVCYEYL